MSKQKRWYAEWCPYGCDCISGGDTLMYFGSAAERDEMVERINGKNSDKAAGCARAISYDEARASYRVQDINTERERQVLNLRTCAGRPFWEVASKMGGVPTW